MVHWAQTIGPHTAQLFERIMSDKPHPEMGWRGAVRDLAIARRWHPRPAGPQRPSHQHARGIDAQEAVYQADGLSSSGQM
jgi:hypothetical protein